MPYQRKRVINKYFYYVINELKNLMVYMENFNDYIRSSHRLCRSLQFVILSEHNKVYAVDVVASLIDLINLKKSPIVDKEIEEYLANKRLDLTATLDGNEIYKESDLIIIATQTNHDSKTNKFDTSSVDSVIEQVKRVNPNAWIIIKSTVGVSYTLNARKEHIYDKILFSLEFLREGKALYDNFYPLIIVVGVPEKT